MATKLPQFLSLWGHNFTLMGVDGEMANYKRVDQDTWMYGITLEDIEIYKELEN